MGEGYICHVSQVGGGLSSLLKPPALRDCISGLNRGLLLLKLENVRARTRGKDSPQSADERDGPSSVLAMAVFCIQGSDGDTSGARTIKPRTSLRSSYSSPMASLVLTDSSQLTADSFKKLPDQITYPHAEPDL
uniref:Uncharacterized protein n=1 Tax=Timema douglasi TaxID=61478 RepID=A0A7R8VGK0_TIMDO|nr:unnamed protein product [Timema douglasi]